MKHNIYFTDNSNDTLNKLKSLGFYICPCCSFNNTKWIHFYYRTLYTNPPKKEFHGIGYKCENDCENADSIKCITCSLQSCITHSKKTKETIHIFSDIDEMIEYINNIYP